MVALTLDADPTELDSSLDSYNDPIEPAPTNPTPSSSPTSYVPPPPSAIWVGDSYNDWIEFTLSMPYSVFYGGVDAPSTKLDTAGFPYRYDPGTEDLFSFRALSGPVLVDLSQNFARIGTRKIGIYGFEAVVGSQGNDTIIGSQGDDRLGGHDGNDSLFGGDGNDLLRGGTGQDTLDGGAGSDWVSYRYNQNWWGLETGVFVDLATNRVSGGHANGDVIRNIENVVGSEWHDTIIGNSGANVLDGHDGNDVIVGGGGSDVLRGGNGNDTLLGQGGGDILVGFRGNDTFIGNGQGGEIVDYSENYHLSANSVFVSYGAVTVFLFEGKGYGEAAGDVYVGIRNVRGTWENDALYGDLNANQLFGDRGADYISGLDGNDSLTGDSGRDTLVGGNGNDTLVGGADVDLLFGGAGADLFVVGKEDIVFDFQRGIDKIKSLGGRGSFAELSITDTISNGQISALVASGTESFIVQGVSAANLIATDFVF